MEKAPTLEELLESVRGLPDMTAEERIEQKIDWVWGNLEASTRHKPSSKQAIAAMAWRSEWHKLRHALAAIATVVDDPDIAQFVKEVLR